MTSRRQYRRRAGTVVTAVRLDLDTEGFTYRKWGDVQHCKAGDWVVDHDGDVHTVDADSFARTYRRVGPGRYEKHGVVWAEQANRSGAIETKEGRTHFEAGDYLVFNDEAGTDGYAMDAERFEELYEEAERRRSEISADIQEARREHEEGATRAASPDDLIHDILP